MNVLVVGGTSGLGLEVARRCAGRGDEVTITGRDPHRAIAVAETLGPGVRSLALELTEPAGIAAALASVERVDGLVLAAIDRDENTVRDYDVADAVRLVTLKLVGYTEVVHALLPALHDDSSIVVFGGRAKDRPYPGSTTVSTINGGVVGMVNAMVTELAPIRVNALHPGVVGDSPFWAAKPAAALERHRSRTPTGRLASMADVAAAAEFLLANRSVNGVHLDVDGGWLLT